MGLWTYGLGRYGAVASGYQQPMMTLVKGEGRLTQELAQEARQELAAVAAKHFRNLAGSSDPLLPFLSVILAECGTVAAVTAGLSPIAPI
jgi:hypothetical protein